MDQRDDVRGLDPRQRGHPGDVGRPSRGIPRVSAAFVAAAGMSTAPWRVELYVGRRAEREAGWPPLPEL